MKLKYFLFFIFLQKVYAQNMIPDPHVNNTAPIFPLTEKCSCNTKVEFNLNSKYWKVNLGTPDIVIPQKECSIHENSSILKDSCIAIFKVINEDKIYIERIETNLNKKIIKNNKYFISIDVFKDRYKVLRENIEFYKVQYKQAKQFSLQARFFNSADSTYSKPIRFEKSCFKAKGTWHKYIAEYKADNYYDKIIIGYPEDTLQKISQRLLCYLYLDNFQLYTLKDLPKLNKVDSLKEPFISVYFNTNKSTLIKLEKDKIQSFLDNINILQIDTVYIVGHTDKTGSFAYNQNLSEKRALKIKELILNRLDAPHLIFKTKGRSFLDSKKEGLQDKERRVDVYFSISEKYLIPWYNVSIKNPTVRMLSYIGEIKTASKVNNDAEYLKIPVRDKEKINTRYINAKRYIFKKSKEANILMINEAHHIPYHRIFASELLDTLYKNGYRYLAVEALNNENIKSLNYKEPFFKKYLEKAKELGFKLIAYDINRNKRWQPQKEGIDTTIFRNRKIEYINNQNISDDGAEGMNTRDYNEYLNLKPYLKEVSPTNKMLIFCGYGHLKIKRSGFWFPLGYYLKRDFGKKLISIDQVSLNDCQDYKKNEYVKLIKPEQAAILTSKKGLYIKKEFDIITHKREVYYDMQVLHPKDRFVPAISKKSIYFSDLKEEYKYPVLLMIYDIDSNPLTDIAFDLVQLDNKNDKKITYIPQNNKYKIVLKDRNDKIIYYGVNN